MVFNTCQYTVDITSKIWEIVIMNRKTDKIIDLTRNKTKKTSIMINEELWELFKTACSKNSTTPTLKFEKWMINFVDENGLI